MKKLLLTLLLALPLAVFAQETNPKPFVIPELRQWMGATGSFTVANDVAIIVEAANAKELESVAQQFAADMKEMFGFAATVKTGAMTDGAIYIRLGKNSTDNVEGYTINTRAKSLEVTANAKIGAYWATRSLLQILEQSETKSIPCGVAVDYPAYPMRGFMLDAGRKFFSMDFLKKYVKFMSYYKMNTFQVHLNDNGFDAFFGNDWDKTYAAFRLESETYPGLAAKDGHYTKKEFRDFMITSRELGVEIIPEIDAPAHTLAFTHYMPEIGSKKYGMDHLDLFNPKTYEFMDGLFKEYLEGENPVFADRYVHIGTDEYSNKDQDVVEKFRYFTDHYIKYIESFGKKAVVWGALTHAKGKTPVKVEDVLMACWYNGYGDPKAMIELGYDVFSIPDGIVYIVPEAGYYHDYLNTKYLYDNWTPAKIGNQTFAEGHPQIKGGMFAVWNDHVGNGISFQDVHHRVFPAMQTLAVKMWDGPDVSLPYNEFNVKRELLSEAPGVNLLARVKGVKGEVLNVEKLEPGQTLPLEDIGYGYSVEFDLKAGKNPKGAKLFSSKNAVFYLSDPKNGKLGFSRDGYDYNFDYVVPTGKSVFIKVEGTNKYTSLYVDGKLVEKLDVKTQMLLDKGSNKHLKLVQTLVFPLETVGKFNGTISNLKVFNDK